MKYSPIAIAFLGLLASASAHATGCEDAADQATMNHCAAQEYKAADARLNDLFHQMRQRLSGDADTQKLLRDSERTWVAFRDAECTFAASATVGGSAYTLVYDGCLTELTKQRSAQLQQYLSAEEGDMSSPLPPAQ